METSRRRSAHADARALLQRVLREPLELERLEAHDLDLALRLVRRARLLGHQWHRLIQRSDPPRLPSEARDQLESGYLLAEATSRLALWELNRVASALWDEWPSKLLVLKGCAYALAQLPNRSGRHFADADLLVAEAELSGVEARLHGGGWHFTDLSSYDERYYRSWTHELPPLKHASRGVEVDVHHNILQRTGRIKIDAAKLLGSAVPVAGTRFQRFCDTDMVLHAVAHLFVDSDMADRLRDLVDIDVLLRHFEKHDHAFHEALVQRASELGLARPLFYALRYTQRFLGTPVAAAALTAAGRGAPPAWVLRIMDALVERALFPQHPDRRSSVTLAARFLLFVRVHWLRMPPLLLARHLAYKLILGARGKVLRKPTTG